MDSKTNSPINESAGSKTPWHLAAAKCEQSALPWAMATIISHRGSTPRDSGTKMIITTEYTYDTVGGGKLEFDIINESRQLLLEKDNQQRLINIPLSVKAKQCCGGTVTVLLESFVASKPHLYLFGAGHIARALVTIMEQLDVRITWIDQRQSEFPSKKLSNVEHRVTEDYLGTVNQMQENALALVITHSHALDYNVIEALLDRKDCRFIGLIGSKTKALRFKKRLRSASFSTQAIDSVHCPVGLLDVPGKQPMAIAISIAAQLLQYNGQSTTPNKNKSKDLSWHDMQDLLCAELQ